MELPISRRAPAESVFSRYQGCISVAPNGRYFRDEAGQGFIVIGQNDAVTWPGLVNLMDGSSPQTTEAYIRDLRAHGINVSRVMIEYAQFPFGLFETSPGTFAPHLVRFWDEFIALAERHGLYLLLTPYDTFWQVKNWDTYPYNAENGGACKTLHDWLISRECIQAQKARWEFIIKRWGGSPNIFAWDLMNEIELYWGCSPAEINDYITEMAAFVRDTEQAHGGRAHLVTASAATPVPSGALAQIIYNHPSLDFATTHLYVGLGVRDPLDTIECACETIDGVRLSQQSIVHPRPYLDTESGPMDVWITDPEFDREYHHNMSWAHLISGGAGSGMRWPYTDPHYILPELRENLLPLAHFSRTIDWARFDSHNITDKIRVEKPGIIKTGCASSNMALLWLLVDTRVSQPSELSGSVVQVCHVLSDGNYTVELWDTYTGCIVGHVAASAMYNNLKFTLPTLDPTLNDLALVIRKVE